MREHEFVTEMPINVHNLNVGTDDEASSFHSDDRKLLNSEKAIAKIKRVWHSSVVDVDLFTLDVKVSPEAALDIGIDGHSFEDGVTLQDIERIKGLDDIVHHSPQFDPNAISMVLTNNAGGERLPLTGWIIAHRLFHCLQMVSHVPGSGRGGTTSNSKSLYNAMMDVNIQYKAVIGDLKNVASSAYGIACMIGSTKACRDGNLSHYEEFLPECFAQYMLRGKVTLRPFPSEDTTIIMRNQPVEVRINRANLLYGNRDIKSFEDYLNKAFAQIVNLAKGLVVAI